MVATVLLNFMQAHHVEDVMLPGPGDQELVTLLTHTYARGDKDTKTQKPEPPSHFGMVWSMLGVQQGAAARATTYHSKETQHLVPFFGFRGQHILVAFDYSPPGAPGRLSR